MTLGDWDFFGGGFIVGLDFFGGVTLCVFLLYPAKRIELEKETRASPLNFFYWICLK